MSDYAHNLVLAVAWLGAVGGCVGAFVAVCGVFMNAAFGEPTRAWWVATAVCTVLSLLAWPYLVTQGVVHQ